jgi:glutamate--cysteine ligase
MNSFTISTKDQLEKFACSQWQVWNEYLDQKMQHLPIPFTSSVDIRESKDKVAPIDLNIYPAGFNNICQQDRENAPTLIRKVILQYAPGAKTVGIITESHTKNLFYLDHLAYLKKMIFDAGFDCHFISFDEHLFLENSTKIELTSHSGFGIELKRAHVLNHQIALVDQSILAFDFILMNNDQSAKMNIDWKSLHVPVHPTPHIGWFRRDKGEHFEAYHQVVRDFSQHFSIDPSIIEAKFFTLDGIDFSSKEGLDKIAQTVDLLKSNLPEEASIFVKAAQGTYGMGISVVKNGQEIIEMNRKERNKMDVGKNGIKFHRVVVQEGIETILKYDEMPAEVTIYLIHGKSVGGFMRTNTEKDARSNLNSRGMVFQKFCISELRANQDYKSKECLYTLCARLSTLAGCLEIERITKEG